MSISACAAPSVPAAPFFSNPVIAGFAPDPSIVRVGADFYLVTSSFETFPALPIYHSRDLVNWALIGHALSDPAVAGLEAVESSGGVQAATIRFHEGLFYVVTTSVVHGKPSSFIVTSRDPKGPWSAPHLIIEAEGIDPSLLFDDDGRVWYTANRVPPDPQFPGQTEIWLQELDLARFALVGPRTALWRGCCQGVWAEAPHLYKKGGRYYLMIAEGGTSLEHAVSVAVSKAVAGPYVNNPRNPVLTHRHLSADYPITGVGHADLVELADGRWYAVALGWRLLEGRHGTLGRETFLVPVTWETEREWWKEDKLSFPVFSPNSGKVELHPALPYAGNPQNAFAGFSDRFDAPKLGPEWTGRRAQRQPFYSLSERPGALRLALQAGSVAEEGASYSFLGIRQRHFQFTASTHMTFTPAAKEEAGLMVVQKDGAAATLTCALSEAGVRVLRLTRFSAGERRVLAERAAPAGAAFLRVVGDALDYQFETSADGRAWLALGPTVDGRLFSPAVLRGFNYTGVFVGLYASANGRATQNHADFDAFDYRSPPGQRDAWFERQTARP